MASKLMSRASWLTRYTVAVAAVSAGVLLRVFLTALVGEGLPTFITFFPFLMLAGLLGGFGPGLFTTAAFALVADYWLMAPRGQFGAGQEVDAMSLAVFCGMGVFISVMMELYRRARQRAESALKQLSPWERQEVQPRPWSERLLLGGGLLVSLSILVGAGWQAQRSTAAIYEADRRVTHTYAVGEEADHLLAAFQDLQASVRGYLLTGRSEYLESYAGTVSEPAKRLAALKSQTSDNPAQVHRVATLEQLVAAKLAIWKQVLDVRRTNGLAAAQALIASSDSKALTDDIRAQLDQIQQAEDQVLAERTRVKDASLRHTRQAVLAGGTLSLLILAAVFVFLVQENQWRREAESEVRRHRDHLQELVAARTAELGEANERLRQQREWLHVTLRSIVDAVLAADNSGKITFLNPVAQTLTGWPEREALGRPIQEIFRTINETTGLAGEDIFARALREGGTVALANHTALVARDGTRIPIEDSAAPIRDAAGRTSGVVLVFHDVTEKRRTQQAMIESQRQNAFLAGVLEHSSQPFAIGYLDGRLGLLNRAFEELTGYTAEELQSINWEKVLTPPEWRDVELQKLRELHQAGQPVRYEKEYITKDGSRVPIELLVHLARDAEGKPEYYYSFLTDITARKRREKELQRLNRTLKALMDSSRAMMHATSEKQYLQEVCRIMVEDCGHALVWIGFAEQDEAKSVRPVAYAGFEEGYLQTLQISWADTERGRGPTGTAIRTGKPDGCPDMMSDPRFAPWREDARQRGYASSLVMPLLAGGNAFGALTIYAREPRAFSEEEVHLLGELADDVSYCIAALRLRADRDLAERLGTAINSVNAVIHSTLDPTQILQSAVSEAAKAVGCDTAAISFQRNGHWVVEHTHGLPAEAIGMAIASEQEPHAELAVRMRQPVAVSDAFNDERVNRQHMREWGVRSVLVVPLVTDHAAHRALFLNFEKTVCSFNRLHVDFARKLASSLSLALENARLYGELRRELAERERAERRTELLAEVASRLLSSEAPMRVVEGLCQKVLAFLECQLFFNFLAEGEHAIHPSTDSAAPQEVKGAEAAAPGDERAPVQSRGRLRLNAFDGIPAEEARKIEWLDYGAAVCGCVARDGCPIVAENIADTADPRTELVKSYGIQAYACYPLMSEGQVLGTLSFGTRTRARFSEEDFSLMKAVADYVAIALERQQVQEVLRERAEELRRSNRDLEQFAYVASHDLQEPLRAVGGYIRLLERRVNESLDARGRELLNGAIEGALRMERLIQDLLAYSRVGSRGGRFVAADLETLLTQVLGHLQVSLQSNPITFTHDPLPTLRVDATQIMQLLQNLIGNALKFRGAHPLRIHVSAEKQAGRWVFGVHDNGIGIEPEYFERIFQLFQRLHTRADYPGTGIGLAICKRIVERHGGAIWVESKLGSGATFYFTIPAAS